MVALLQQLLQQLRAQFIRGFQAMQAGAFAAAGLRMPAQPILILQLLHQRAGVPFAAVEHRRQLADGHGDRRVAELLVQALILAETVNQAHGQKSGTVFSNCSLLLPQIPSHTALIVIAFTFKRSLCIAWQLSIWTARC